MYDGRPGGLGMKSALFYEYATIASDQNESHKAARHDKAMLVNATTYDEWSRRTRLAPEYCCADKRFASG